MKHTVSLAAAAAILAIAAAPALARDWYEIRDYKLSESGECLHCGTRVAGRYQKFGKPFGARRIPVRFAPQERGL